MLHLGGVVAQRERNWTSQAAGPPSPHPSDQPPGASCVNPAPRRRTYALLAF